MEGLSRSVGEPPNRWHVHRLILVMLLAMYTYPPISLDSFFCCDISEVVMSSEISGEQLSQGPTSSTTGTPTSVQMAWSHRCELLWIGPNLVKNTSLFSTLELVYSYPSNKESITRHIFFSTSRNACCIDLLSIQPRMSPPKKTIVKICKILENVAKFC